MSQIISITSEALQATVRRLLPSQQGFGEDLQASNVIQPVIDLTSTAEGSDIPTSFAQALSFDVTDFDRRSAGTTQIISNTGFFRVFTSVEIGQSANDLIAITMDDGSTTKTLIKFLQQNSTTGGTMMQTLDFLVCVGAGQSVSVVQNGSNSSCIGSTRQVGLLDGTLINPTAYAPQ
mgnify:CR=1 FL=1